MKRQFQKAFTAIMAAAFMLLPMVASAQLTPEKTGLKTAAARTGLATSCTGADCLTAIVGNTINVVLGFLGIVLFAMLIYSGWQWMTAGGDSKQVTDAKARIFNAVAGLVIIAASYAISTFVLFQLATLTGGSGAGSSSGAGVGAACTATSDCAPVVCSDGSSHAGLCVAGACNNYVCP